MRVTQVFFVMECILIFALKSLGTTQSNDSWCNNCVCLFSRLVLFRLSLMNDFMLILGSLYLCLKCVVTLAHATCVQFSSVTQSCLTLCDSMNRSTPGLPDHHQLSESTQTHVHWVGDAIQPSHPLSSPSPALNLSQHQGLFQWVSSLHEVAKVLEFQLQHQSFQWTSRTDLL